MESPLPTSSGVLIGDADPVAAQILRELLEQWSYAVEVLDDGHAVLRRMLEPAPPAVVLVDTNLTGLPALEIIAEFRRRTQKKPVWTMLTSEDASPEMIQTASDAGVDDFLLKPIDSLDLRVRMRTAERVQAIYTDLELQMEAVRFHASHDRLTGLLNREALLSMLFQETDRVQRMKTPLTLLLLDLDGFSQVNIEHGYAAGDRILKELAQRFRRYLRNYDLAGRCGEDEFLVGLPGCAPEHALSMASRLMKTIFNRPFQLQHEEVAVTASIGLAQSRGRSPLVVLREAERAMADAKLSGRNCIRLYGQGPSRFPQADIESPLPEKGALLRHLEASMGG